MSNAEARAAVASRETANTPDASAGAPNETDAERVTRQAVEQGRTVAIDNRTGEWSVAPEGKARVLYGAAGREGMWVIVDSEDKVWYSGTEYSPEAAAMAAENPRKMAEEALKPVKDEGLSEAEKIQAKALGN